MIQRHRVHLTALSLLIAACEADSVPSSGTHGGGAAALGGWLRLTPSPRWIHVNPAGPMLYSPTISPDGRWIAASGIGGADLHVVSSDGSVGPLLVGPRYRGARTWSTDPVALHFGLDGPDRAEPRRWHAGARDVEPDSQLRHKPIVAPYGQLEHEGAGASWYFDPLRGTITRVRRDRAAEVVVDDGGAWGLTVSPDGTAVAWCTGILADARVHVRRAEGGQRLALGPGTYPAWFPDSRHVVFSRHVATAERGPYETVLGADLVMWDALTGVSWELTNTADIEEMEPVVAPDGRWVAFSDWRGGGLYRAATVEGEAP